MCDTFTYKTHIVNPFDTPPTGRGLLRVDGERHTNNLPSSPEPQAEGTPSQDPRPARGPRRGVEGLETVLERFREIATDSGAENE